MWLMTKFGFYSIVEKEPGVLNIRSRERQDLQNLIDHVPLPACSILETPEGDYAARIVTDRETVNAVLHFLAACRTSAAPPSARLLKGEDALRAECARDGVEEHMGQRARAIREQKRDAWIRFVIA